MKMSDATQNGGGGGRSSFGSLLFADGGTAITSSELQWREWRLRRWRCVANGNSGTSGAGGTDGGNGANSASGHSGGTGQGTFSERLQMFRLNAFTAGSGGAGATWRLYWRRRRRRRSDERRGPEWRQGAIRQHVRRQRVRRGRRGRVLCYNANRVTRIMRVAMARTVSCTSSGEKCNWQEWESLRPPIPDTRTVLYHFTHALQLRRKLCFTPHYSKTCVSVRPMVHWFCVTLIEMQHLTGFTISYSIDSSVVLLYPSLCFVLVVRSLHRFRVTHFLCILSTPPPHDATLILQIQSQEFFHCIE